MLNEDDGNTRQTIRFVIVQVVGLMLTLPGLAQELTMTPLGPKAGDQAEVIKEFENFIIYKGDTLNRKNASGQKTGDWVEYRKAYLRRTTGEITVIDSTNVSYVVERKGRFENGEKVGLWNSYYMGGQIKNSIQYDR